MSLKKQLKDFSEELPVINSKIILFYPVELHKSPIATKYEKVSDYVVNGSYVLVNNEVLEMAWLYLNIRQLVKE
jgi:hypothetical protein